MPPETKAAPRDRGLQPPGREEEEGGRAPVAPWEPPLLPPFGLAGWEGCSRRCCCPPASDDANTREEKGRRTDRRDAPNSPPFPPALPLAHLRVGTCFSCRPGQRTELLHHLPAMREQQCKPRAEHSPSSEYLRPLRGNFLLHRNFQTCPLAPER